LLHAISLIEVMYIQNKRWSRRHSSFDSN